MRVLFGPARLARIRFCGGGCAKVSSRQGSVQAYRTGHRCGQSASAERIQRRAAATLTSGAVTEPIGYSRQVAGHSTRRMLTVGGIIGGGIFLNPAVVAQRVHTAPLIVAPGCWRCDRGHGSALLRGAGRAAAGGGRRVCLPQGRLPGTLPAFLYGWTFLVIVNTGGMAAVAVTFARYTTDSCTRATPG